MRLLNTSTLSLEEYEGSQLPGYAILSHTWSAGELTYQEALRLSKTAKSKPGFLKVRNLCGFAQGLGFDHVWIDTCCIDKKSSAELTEAINSMFQWYQRAEVCIVHLEDVEGTQQKDCKRHFDLLKGCRWFTRGWTLQELVASRKRIFVGSDWQILEFDHVGACSSIARIDRAVLLHTRKLSQVCVAERMSWAAVRETTRAEDRAYSLMGLFQVSMPIMYGEGMRNAFRRLQEEIMKRSFDQTMFAWSGPYESSGLLARSPSDFKDTPTLSMWAPDALAPYSMTNTGILIRLFLFNLETSETDVQTVSAVLQCDVELNGVWTVVAISLQHIPEAYCWVNGKKCEAFRRIQSSCYSTSTRPFTIEWDKFAEILILEDEHFELVQQSVDENTERWSTALQRIQVDDQEIHDPPAPRLAGEIALKRLCSSPLHTHLARQRGSLCGPMTFRSLKPIAERVRRGAAKEAKSESSVGKSRAQRRRNHPQSQTARISLSRNTDDDSARSSYNDSDGWISEDRKKLS